MVSSGDANALDSHRALIATVFCDLPGFTTFSETAEPEEAMEVLQAYHKTMGLLIHEHRDTIDHRAGDGIMIIFNDPLPCEDPTGEAVRMDELIGEWRKLRHRLGFGVGLSLGYATIGVVGYEGRYNYTANGSSVNLAARLADEAADGQILISQRAHTALGDTVHTESIGDLVLTGVRELIAQPRSPALRQMWQLTAIESSAHTQGAPRITLALLRPSRI